MKKLLSVLLVVAMLLTLAVSFASAEGKTIVYWSMWDAAEPQGKVIQKAVDAYVAATGNKVDLQFKGRDGIRQGLEPALEAGTTIDMFDEDIDRVNKQWGKYLLDLEELAKANDYEATAMSALIGACREVAGDKLMSIPYQPFVFSVFYNKALFDKVGIVAEPETWEDFLAACTKLKEADIIPLTSDDAYLLTNLGYHLARYIGEDGVAKVLSEGLWAEEPAVLKTAQDYELLFKEGYLSPTMGSSSWPTNQNGELALEEAAMYLNGSWLPNEIKEVTGPDFQWGCMAYPALPEGKTGIEAANYGAQVLAINNKSEVAAEAFEIIKYITKGEFDQMLADETIGIPSDTSNENWPAQQAPVKTLMPKLSTRYSWAAGIMDNNDLTPILKENFSKLVGGEIDAQTFVDVLEAASGK